MNNGVKAVYLRDMLRFVYTNIPVNTYVRYYFGIINTCYLIKSLLSKLFDQSIYYVSQVTGLIQ